MGKVKTESVLFVCALNICRSPLMSAAFQDALRAQGELGLGRVAWAIDSAGTEASDGRRACRYAVDITHTAVGHHSVRLAAANVDSADLVIVATLEERALVARMRPRARSRTFTLREALLLGEHPISATSLAEYATALDLRRGTLDLPRPRSLPWSRPAHSPLDVVDVHQRGAHTHRKGLEKAAIDARLLAFRLRRDITLPG